MAISPEQPESPKPVILNENLPETTSRKAMDLPVNVDALRIFIDPGYRESFIAHAESILNTGSRAGMAGIHITGINNVMETSIAVREGYQNYGSQTYDYMEIKLQLDEEVAFDETTLDSLARFYAYEVLERRLDFRYTGVTTRRLFAYEHSDRADLEQRLALLMSSGKKGGDRKHEGVSHLSKHQAVPIIWGPQSTATDRSKEARRRNNLTKTKIWIGTKSSLEAGMTDRAIPACEKDDCSWADGIILNTARPKNIKTEQIQMSPDRRALHPISFDTRANQTREITIRIPNNRSSDICELDLYFILLGITDIIRTTPQPEKEAFARVQFDSTTPKSSVGPHYLQEIRSIYYQLVRERRRYASIDMLPDLKPQFQQLLINTVVPLGEGRMQSVNDTFLAGAAGSGKSSILRILEHGDVYSEYNLPIMAVGDDNIITFMNRPIVDRLTQKARRYGMELMLICNDADALLQPNSDTGSQTKYDPMMRQYLLQQLGDQSSIPRTMAIIGSVNYATLVDGGLARRVKYVYVPAFHRDPFSQFKIASTLCEAYLETVDSACFDFDELRLLYSELGAYLSSYPPAFLEKVLKLFDGDYREYLLRTRKAKMPSGSISIVMQNALRNAANDYPIDTIRADDEKLARLFGQQVDVKATKLIPPYSPGKRN